MTKRPEFLPFCLTALTVLIVGALLLAHVEVPEALYGLLVGAGAAFLALVHPTAPATTSLAVTGAVDGAVDAPSVTAAMSGTS